MVSRFVFGPRQVGSMNAGKEQVELKWTTRCITCKNRVRCINEKVERGSKKCINLLRLLEKQKSS